LILVAGNNLLLGANHKSLVTQNCEYKSTLPKTIDEFFTCGDGVPKFNAQKLNITNKKKKKKRNYKLNYQIDLSDDIFD
jgi:hypothetical protein